MPKDARGNFHGNIQRAMAADRSVVDAPAPKPAKPARGIPMSEPDGDESGAGKHLQNFHDAMGGGKAMMVHHDGINLTSHQVGEDGEVSGPHDHANLDELKASMDQFLSEEGAEEVY